MTVTTTTTTTVLPTRREASGRELFVLVAAAQLAASLQFAMVSVALPDVVADLGTSLRWASWAISLFTMAQAVALPVLGKLSDGIGRRTVFVGGIALFGAASVVCALAPNVGVLIAARAVQGVAAGSLLPSAYGIVGDVFTGPNRTRVMGLISSIFPIGAIVGPNIGGLLVEHAGWRWTFLVNAPIAAVAAVWGWQRLPRAHTLSGGGRLDWRGAGLLTGSVGALMIAVTELGHEDGAADVRLVAVCLVGAVALGVALVRHERRCRDPLVDLGLLRRREFAFLNALNFFYGVCVFGMVSFVPLYAQEGYGFTASEAGVLLAPRAVAMLAMSIGASMVILRTGFRRPIAVGLVVMAVSGLLLSFGPGLAARSHLGDFGYLTVVVAMLGVGLGFAGPSANQAGLDLVPDQVAAITGLRGMFRALGGALGTAAIASIAGRADSHAVGLEQSFAIIAVLALGSLVFLGGIPDRPATGGAPNRRSASADRRSTSSTPR
jgi:EmrB/QacA subfamily drug resistance transporter